MIVSTTISIGWLSPFPGWLWAILLFGCVTLAWWTYCRFDIPTWSRWCLGIIRTTSLLVILVYLAGPVVEWSEQDHIDDRIIILIDRSESMETRDVVGPGGELMSRDGQLASILNETDVWNDVTGQRQVEWFGFHEHLFPIPDPIEHGFKQSSTAGSGTDIVSSINQIDINRSLNPVAGLVLVSDGRTGSVSTQETTSSLRSMGIPVFTVPVGSPDGGVDIGIESTKSPEFAFIGDTVPIIVDISRTTGPTDQDGDIVLRDVDSGDELDRIPLESDRNRYTLVGESVLEGDVRWVVEIDHSGSDLVSINNMREVVVEMIDEPLRVLYVEGYPRWEYRYLKNLLMREESITSSIMLLSADKGYAQEGDRAITRLPSTRDEFEEFDVVVIGDVPASSISREQQRIMEEMIIDGDLGIGWIGGSRWTPSDWSGGPLSGTIPFDAPIMPQINGSPVHMIPTRESGQIGILRIEDGTDSMWPADLSDASVPWSAFQWSQVVDDGSLKPTTEILATTMESTVNPSGVSPLLLGMRYGAGRSIYSTTDELWRWRHGRGERFYEQFWIQIIRSLARSNRDLDEPVRLEVVPTQVQVGRPQQVRLIIRDALLVEDLGDIVALRLTSDSGANRTLELTREPGSSGTWSTTWIPTSPGGWSMVPLQPTIGDSVSREFIVADRSGETTNPATDHHLLERISIETGGELVGPGNLSQLQDLIPDRSITTTITRQQTIWNRWWLLVVPLLLFGIEWIGRRAFRLA